MSVPAIVRPSPPGVDAGGAGAGAADPEWPNHALANEIRNNWNPWPEDFASDARALGDAWLRSWQAMHSMRVGGLAAAGRLEAIWEDTAGIATRLAATEYLQQLLDIENGMYELAIMSYDYARELWEAKAQIVIELGLNLAGYLGLGGIGGVIGKLLAKAFAASVAKGLFNILARGAARLMARPVGSVRNKIGQKIELAVNNVRAPVVNTIEGTGKAAGEEVVQEGLTDLGSQGSANIAGHDNGTKTGIDGGQLARAMGAGGVSAGPSKFVRGVTDRLIPGGNAGGRLAQNVIGGGAANFVSSPTAGHFVNSYTDGDPETNPWSLSQHLEAIGEDGRRAATIGAGHGAVDTAKGGLGNATGLWDGTPPTPKPTVWDMFGGGDGPPSPSDPSSQSSAWDQYQNGEGAPIPDAGASTGAADAGTAGAGAGTGANSAATNGAGAPPSAGSAANASSAGAGSNAAPTQGAPATNGGTGTASAGTSGDTTEATNGTDPSQNADGQANGDVQIDDEAASSGQENTEQAENPGREDTESARQDTNETSGREDTETTSNSSAETTAETTESTGQQSIEASSEQNSALAAEASTGTDVAADDAGETGAAAPVGATGTTTAGAAAPVSTTTPSGVPSAAPKHTTSSDTDENPAEASETPDAAAEHRPTNEIDPESIPDLIRQRLGQDDLVLEPVQGKQGVWRHPDSGQQFEAIPVTEADFRSTQRRIELASLVRKVLSGWRTPYLAIVPVGLSAEQAAELQKQYAELSARVLVVESQDAPDPSSEGTRQQGQPSAEADEVVEQVMNKRLGSDRTRVLGKGQEAIVLLASKANQTRDDILQSIRDAAESRPKAIVVNVSQLTQRQFDLLKGAVQGDPALAGIKIAYDDFDNAGHIARRRGLPTPRQYTRIAALREDQLDEIFPGDGRTHTFEHEGRTTVGLGPRRGESGNDMLGRINAAIDNGADVVDAVISHLSATQKAKLRAAVYQRDNVRLDDSAEVREITKHYRDGHAEERPAPRERSESAALNEYRLDQIFTENDRTRLLPDDGGKKVIGIGPKPGETVEELLDRIGAALASDENYDLVWVPAFHLEIHAGELLNGLLERGYLGEQDTPAKALRVHVDLDHAELRDYTSHYGNRPAAEPLAADGQIHHITLPDGTKVRYQLGATIIGDDAATTVNADRSVVADPGQSSGDHRVIVHSDHARSLTPTAIAAIVQANPYVNGANPLISRTTDLTFVSCFTGSAGWLQAIADETGLTTWGPLDEVAADQDTGELIVHRFRTDPENAWVMFIPGTPGPTDFIDPRDRPYDPTFDHQHAMADRRDRPYEPIDADELRSRIERERGSPLGPHETVQAIEPFDVTAEDFSSTEALAQLLEAIVDAAHQATFVAFDVTQLTPGQLEMLDRELDARHVYDNHVIALGADTVAGPEIMPEIEPPPVDHIAAWIEGVLPAETRVTRHQLSLSSYQDLHGTRFSAPTVTGADLASDEATTALLDWIRTDLRRGVIVVVNAAELDSQQTEQLAATLAAQPDLTVPIVGATDAADRAALPRNPVTEQDLDRRWTTARIYRTYNSDNGTIDLVVGPTTHATPEVLLTRIRHAIATDDAARVVATVAEFSDADVARIMLAIQTDPTLSARVELDDTPAQPPSGHLDVRDTLPVMAANETAVAAPTAFANEPLSSVYRPHAYPTRPSALLQTPDGSLRYVMVLVGDQVVTPNGTFEYAPAAFNEWTSSADIQPATGFSVALDRAARQRDGQLPAALRRPPIIVRIHPHDAVRKLTEQTEELTPERIGDLAKTVPGLPQEVHAVVEAVGKLLDEAARLPGRTSWSLSPSAMRPLRGDWSGRPLTEIRDLAVANGNIGKRIPEPFVTVSGARTEASRATLGALEKLKAAISLLQWADSERKATTAVADLGAVLRNPREHTVWLVTDPHQLPATVPDPAADAVPGAELLHATPKRVHHIDGLTDETFDQAVDEGLIDEIATHAANGEIRIDVSPISDLRLFELRLLMDNQLPPESRDNVVLYRRTHLDPGQQATSGPGGQEITLESILATETSNSAPVVFADHPIATQQEAERAAAPAMLLQTPDGKLRPVVILRSAGHDPAAYAAWNGGGDIFVRRMSADSTDTGYDQIPRGRRLPPLFVDAHPQAGIDALETHLDDLTVDQVRALAQLAADATPELQDLANEVTQRIEAVERAAEQLARDAVTGGFTQDWFAGHSLDTLTTKASDEQAAAKEHARTAVTRRTRSKWESHARAAAGLQSELAELKRQVRTLVDGDYALKRDVSADDLSAILQNPQNYTARLLTDTGEIAVVLPTPAQEPIAGFADSFTGPIPAPVLAGILAAAPGIRSAQQIRGIARRVQQHASGQQHGERPAADELPATAENLEFGTHQLDAAAAAVEYWASRTGHAGHFGSAGNPLAGRTLDELRSAAETARQRAGKPKQADGDTDRTPAAMFRRAAADLHSAIDEVHGAIDEVQRAMRQSEAPGAAQPVEPITFESILATETPNLGRVVFADRPIRSNMEVAQAESPAVMLQAPDGTLRPVVIHRAHTPHDPAAYTTWNGDGTVFVRRIAKDSTDRGYRQIPPEQRELPLVVESRPQAGLDALHEQLDDLTIDQVRTLAQLTASATPELQSAATAVTNAIEMAEHNFATLKRSTYLPGNPAAHGTLGAGSIPDAEWTVRAVQAQLASELKWYGWSYLPGGRERLGNALRAAESMQRHLADLRRAAQSLVRAEGGLKGDAAADDLTIIARNPQNYTVRLLSGTQQTPVVLPDPAGWAVAGLADTAAGPTPVPVLTGVLAVLPGIRTLRQIRGIAQRVLQHAEAERDGERQAEATRLRITADHLDTWTHQVEIAAATLAYWAGAATPVGGRPPIPPDGFAGDTGYTSQVLASEVPLAERSLDELSSAAEGAREQAGRPRKADGDTDRSPAAMFRQATADLHNSIDGLRNAIDAVQEAAVQWEAPAAEPVPEPVPPQQPVSTGVASEARVRAVSLVEAQETALRTGRPVEDVVRETRNATAGLAARHGLDVDQMIDDLDQAVDEAYARSTRASDLAAAFGVAPADVEYDRTLPDSLEDAIKQALPDQIAATDELARALHEAGLTDQSQLAGSGFTEQTLRRALLLNDLAGTESVAEVFAQARAGEVDLATALRRLIAETKRLGPPQDAPPLPHLATVFGYDSRTELDEFRHRLAEADIDGLADTEHGRRTLTELAGIQATRYGLTSAQRRRHLEIEPDWFAGQADTMLPIGHALPAPAPPTDSPTVIDSAEFQRTLGALLDHYFYAGGPREHHPPLADLVRVSEALLNGGIPPAARLTAQLPGSRYRGTLRGDLADLGDPNTPGPSQLRDLAKHGTHVRWTVPGDQSIFTAADTAAGRGDLRQTLQRALRAELGSNKQPLWNSMPAFRDTNSRPGAVQSLDHTIAPRLIPHLPRLLAETANLHITVIGPNHTEEHGDPNDPSITLLRTTTDLRPHYMPVLSGRPVAITTAPPVPTETAPEPGIEEPSLPRQIANELATAAPVADGQIHHRTLPGGIKVRYQLGATTIGDDPAALVNADRSLVTNPQDLHGDHRVIVHGRQDGPPVINGVELTPTMIATIVQANPYLNGANPLVAGTAALTFVSCFAGSAGWLQAVADETGLTTRGPLEHAVTNLGREVDVHKFRTDPTNAWVEFTPGTPAPTTFIDPTHRPYDPTFDHEHAMRGRRGQPLDPDLERQLDQVWGGPSRSSVSLQADGTVAAVLGPRAHQTPVELLIRIQQALTSDNGAERVVASTAQFTDEEFDRIRGVITGDAELDGTVELDDESARPPAPGYTATGTDEEPVALESILAAETVVAELLVFTADPSSPDPDLAEEPAVMLRARDGRLRPVVIRMPREPSDLAAYMAWNGDGDIFLRRISAGSAEGVYDRIPREQRLPPLVVDMRPQAGVEALAAHLPDLTLTQVGSLGTELLDLQNDVEMRLAARIIEGWPAAIRHDADQLSLRADTVGEFTALVESTPGSSLEAIRMDLRELKEAVHHLVTRDIELKGRDAAEDLSMMLRNPQNYTARLLTGTHSTPVLLPDPSVVAVPDVGETVDGPVPVSTLVNILATAPGIRTLPQIHEFAQRMAQHAQRSGHGHPAQSAHHVAETAEKLKMATYRAEIGASTVEYLAARVTGSTDIFGPAEQRPLADRSLDELRAAVGRTHDITGDDQNATDGLRQAARQLHGQLDELQLAIRDLKHAVGEFELPIPDGQPYVFTAPNGFPVRYQLGATIIGNDEAASENADRSVVTDPGQTRGEHRVIVHGELAKSIPTTEIAGIILANPYLNSTNPLIAPTTQLRFVSCFTGGTHWLQAVSDSTGLTTWGPLEHAVTNLNREVDVHKFRTDPSNAWIKHIPGTPTPTDLIDATHRPYDPTFDHRHAMHGAPASPVEQALDRRWGRGRSYLDRDGEPVLGPKPNQHPVELLYRVRQAIEAGAPHVVAHVGQFTAEQQQHIAEEVRGDRLLAGKVRFTDEIIRVDVAQLAAEPERVQQLQDEIHWQYGDRAVQLVGAPGQVLPPRDSNYIPGLARQPHVRNRGTGDLAETVVLRGPDLVRVRDQPGVWIDKAGRSYRAAHPLTDDTVDAWLDAFSAGRVSTDADVVILDVSRLSPEKAIPLVLAHPPRQPAGAATPVGGRPPIPPDGFAGRLLAVGDVHRQAPPADPVVAEIEAKHPGTFLAPLDPRTWVDQRGFTYHRVPPVTPGRVLNLDAVLNTLAKTQPHTGLLVVDVSRLDAGELQALEQAINSRPAVEQRMILVGAKLMPAAPAITEPLALPTTEPFPVSEATIDRVKTAHDIEQLRPADGAPGVWVDDATGQTYRPLDLGSTVRFAHLRPDALREWISDARPRAVFVPVDVSGLSPEQAEQVDRLLRQLDVSPAQVFPVSGPPVMGPPPPPRADPITEAAALSQGAPRSIPYLRQMHEWLLRHGMNPELTIRDLDDRLHAQWSQITAPDGATQTFEVGGLEVRLRISLSDRQEVSDGRVATRIAHGRLGSGPAPAKAGDARKGWSFITRGSAIKLARATYRRIRELTGGVDARSYAEAGGRLNSISPASVWEALATAELSTVDADGAVIRETFGDPTTGQQQERTRIAVPDAHWDAPSLDTVRKQQQPPEHELPFAYVHWLTGADELVDAVLMAVPEQLRSDPLVRQAVYLQAAELRTQPQQASRTGIPIAVVHEGRTLAIVRVTLQAHRDGARMVGGWAKGMRLEQAKYAADGPHGSIGRRTGNEWLGSLGPLAARMQGMRLGTITTTILAGVTATRLILDRWVGHSHGYLAPVTYHLRYEYGHHPGTAEPLTKADDNVTGQVHGRMLARIREPDAYHYGLPVPAEAVRDGRTRDEPKRDSPGETRTLPTDSSDRLNGQAEIRNLREIDQNGQVVDNLDGIREELLLVLRGQGFLPRGGQGRSVRDTLLNQNAVLVDDLLAPHNLRARYHDLINDGVRLQLVRLDPLEIEAEIVHIHLKLTPRGPEHATYLGTSAALEQVHVDIAESTLESETTGRTFANKGAAGVAVANTGTAESASTQGIERLATYTITRDPDAMNAVWDLSHELSVSIEGEQLHTAQVNVEVWLSKNLVAELSGAPPVQVTQGGTATALLADPATDILGITTHGLFGAAKQARDEAVGEGLGKVNKLVTTQHTALDAATSATQTKLNLKEIASTGKYYDLGPVRTPGSRHWVRVSMAGADTGVVAGETQLLGVTAGAKRSRTTVPTSSRRTGTAAARTFVGGGGPVIDGESARAYTEDEFGDTLREYGIDADSVFDTYHDAFVLGQADRSHTLADSSRERQSVTQEDQAYSREHVYHFRASVELQAEAYTHRARKSPGAAASRSAGARDVTWAMPEPEVIGHFVDGRLPNLPASLVLEALQRKLDGQSRLTVETALAAAAKLIAGHAGQPSPELAKAKAIQDALAEQATQQAEPVLLPYLQELLGIGALTSIDEFRSDADIAHEIDTLIRRVTGFAIDDPPVLQAAIKSLFAQVRASGLQADTIGPEFPAGVINMDKGRPVELIAKVELDTESLPRIVSSDPTGTFESFRHDARQQGKGVTRTPSFNALGWTSVFRSLFSRGTERSREVHHSVVAETNRIAFGDHDGGSHQLEVPVKVTLRVRRAGEPTLRNRVVNTVTDREASPSTTVSGALRMTIAQALADPAHHRAPSDEVPAGTVTRLPDLIGGMAVEARPLQEALTGILTDLDVIGAGVDYSAGEIQRQLAQQSVLSRMDGFLAPDGAWAISLRPAKELGTRVDVGLRLRLHSVDPVGWIDGRGGLGRQDRFEEALEEIAGSKIDSTTRTEPSLLYLLAPFGLTDPTGATGTANVGGTRTSGAGQSAALTAGGRNELEQREHAPTVVVRVRYSAEFDVTRASAGRDAESSRFPHRASGEAYLRVYQHDLPELLEQLAGNDVQAEIEAKLRDAGWRGPQDPPIDLLGDITDGRVGNLDDAVATARAGKPGKPVHETIAKALAETRPPEGAAVLLTADPAAKLIKEVRDTAEAVLAAVEPLVNEGAGATRVAARQAIAAADELDNIREASRASGQFPISQANPSHALHTMVQQADKMVRRANEALAADAAPFSSDWTHHRRSPLQEARGIARELGRPVRLTETKVDGSVVKHQIRADGASVDTSRQPLPPELQERISTRRLDPVVAQAMAITTGRPLAEIVAETYDRQVGEAALNGVDLPQTWQGRIDENATYHQELRQQTARYRAEWDAAWPEFRDALVATGVSETTLRRVLAAEGVGFPGLAEAFQSARRQRVDPVPEMQAVLVNAEAMPVPNTIEDLAPVFGFGDGEIGTFALRLYEVFDPGTSAARQPEQLLRLAEHLAVRYGHGPAQRRLMLEVNPRWFTERLALGAVPGGLDLLAPPPGEQFADPVFAQRLQWVIDRYFHGVPLGQAHRGETLHDDNRALVADAMLHGGLPHAARVASELPGARFPGEVLNEDFTTLLKDPNAPSEAQLRLLDEHDATTRWTRPGEASLPQDARVVIVGQDGSIAVQGPDTASHEVVLLRTGRAYDPHYMPWVGPAPATTATPTPDGPAGPRPDPQPAAYGPADTTADQPFDPAAADTETVPTVLAVMAGQVTDEIPLPDAPTDNLSAPAVQPSDPPTPPDHRRADDGGRRRRRPPYPLPFPIYFHDEEEDEKIPYPPTMGDPPPQPLLPDTAPGQPPAEDHPEVPEPERRTRDAAPPPGEVTEPDKGSSADAQAETGRSEQVKQGGKASQPDDSAGEKPPTGEKDDKPGGGGDGGHGGDGGDGGDGGHAPGTPDALLDLLKELLELLKRLIDELDPALLARIAELLAEHGVQVEVLLSDGRRLRLPAAWGMAPNGKQPADPDLLCAALIMLMYAVGPQLLISALQAGVDIPAAWQEASESGARPQRVLADRTAEAQHELPGEPAEKLVVERLRAVHSNPDDGQQLVGMDPEKLRELLERAGMTEFADEPAPHQWADRIRDAFANTR